MKTQIESRGAPDARTSKDYAIEFGGYLADAAEQFQSAYNLRRLVEDSGDEVDVDAFSDIFRALSSAIYEFRKRAARVEPESETGHVVLLEALRHALPILIGAIAFVDCKAVVAEVRAAIKEAECREK